MKKQPLASLIAFLRPDGPAADRAARRVVKMLQPLMKDASNMTPLEKSYLSQGFLYLSSHMSDESRRAAAAEIRAETFERKSRPRRVAKAKPKSKKRVSR